MGYYVNPPDKTKEDFLADHGLKMINTPEQHFDGKNVAVCLVLNAGFSAAAIAYKQGELEYFADGFSSGQDPRPHQWYMVPLDKLEPYLKGALVP